MRNSYPSFENLAEVVYPNAEGVEQVAEIAKKKGAEAKESLILRFLHD